MNVLDLFSGIGGFSLGLERAGFRTVAFCESDPFCRRFLAKHWPGVPCYDDVRTLTAARLAADGILADVADAQCIRDAGRQWNRYESRHPPNDIERSGKKQSIDLICGGFPCQDLSVAGKGAGITGPQSGLWSEYARIIGEVRPRYAIIENVSALLVRGLDRVLWDLWQIGYDAEWTCIRASDVGAPHRRDRVWIVAYPRREQRPSVWTEPETDQSISHIHDQRCDADVADANGEQFEEQRFAVAIRQELAAAGCDGWWRVEPDVGRVAHGVPARVDRLRSLGNAVVPQIPELIGKAILGRRDGDRR